MRTKLIFLLSVAIVALTVLSWLALPVLFGRGSGSWAESLDHRYVSPYENKFSFIVVLPSPARSSDVLVQIRRKARASKNEFRSTSISEEDADEVFAAGTIILIEGPEKLSSSHVNELRLHISLLNIRMLGIDEKTLDPIRVFVRLESVANITQVANKRFFRGDRVSYFVPGHEDWKGNELRVMSLNSEDVDQRLDYDVVVLLRPARTMLD